MVAFPMFDAMLACAATPQQSSRVAAQLVSSALSDIEQVRKLDESLAPEDPSQFNRRTAAVVREIYETWAHEAQVLINRLELVEKRFGPVAGLKELRDAHGRTMAMLSTSLDDLQHGIRDAAENRTHSAQEVRRELQLRPR